MLVAVNETIVRNYVQERHQRMWREQFLGVLLGTISNGIGVFGMSVRMIIPALLGVSAIFSPAFFFALGVADFAISMAWWVHMHYETYHDTIDQYEDDYKLTDHTHPHQRAYKKAVQEAMREKKAPAEPRALDWWSKFTQNYYVAQTLVFIPNFLLNLEAGLMIVAPTFLGLASPILVMVGFAIFMTRGILDTAKAFIEYRAKTAQMRRDNPADLKQQLRWARNQMAWDFSFHTLTVAGLTIGFAFLLFVPMAPAATFLTALGITASTALRLTLRLFYPNSSIPFNNDKNEKEESTTANKSKTEEKTSYLHEDGVYTYKALMHLATHWDDQCHKLNHRALKHLEAPATTGTTSSDIAVPAPT